MTAERMDRITLERTFQAVFYTLTLITLYYYLFTVHPWLLELQGNIAYKPDIIFMQDDTYPFWYFTEFATISDTPLGIKGPVAIGKLLLNSYILIFLFNAFLLYVTVTNFLKIVGRNNYLFKTLLIFQPFVIVQTFYINKEIYMLISGFLACSYIIKKDLKLLILSMMFSLLTKVEYVAILTAFILISNINKSNFIILSLAKVFIIGILYKEIPGIESKASVLIANTELENFSLSRYFFDLSYNHSAFPLVVLPKVIHVYMHGIIQAIKFPYALVENVTNLSFSITCLVIGSVSVYWSFTHRHLPTTAYFIIIWSVIVATIPFNVPRYLFPIFPFLVSTYLLLKKTQPN